MRRWIAGAAAFYLDILYNHYADIWNSQRMARVSKIAMFTFYSAQLFVYGQVLPLSVCVCVWCGARVVGKSGAVALHPTASSIVCHFSVPVDPLSRLRADGIYAGALSADS